MNRRKRYWIDLAVQGALVRRVVFQWLVFFALCVTILPLWHVITGGDLNGPYAVLLRQAWSKATPVILLMLALLPYFIWDTIKLSNRFAGPMYRIRTALGSLAAGKPTTPIQLRDGDFWQEAAHDFNVILHRLNSLKAQQNEEPTGVGSFGLAPTQASFPTAANDRPGEAASRSDRL